MQWAIALLTFTTVIFRSELLLLLGPLALQASFRYVSLYDVLKTGVIAGLASAGELLHVSSPWGRADSRSVITVLIDSYFWQQWPLWPELYGVYFNVILGKSSEWGVSLRRAISAIVLTVFSAGRTIPHVLQFVPSEAAALVFTPIRVRLPSRPKNQITVNTVSCVHWHHQRTGS